MLLPKKSKNTILLILGEYVYNDKGTGIYENNVSKMVSTQVILFETFEKKLDSSQSN